LIIGAAAALVLLVVAPRLRRSQRAVERPAERHFRSGVALAQAGDGASAVSEWKLAIALDPTYARPYQALASYYEDAGQPALAAQMLQRLAAANPTAPHRDCRLAQAAFAAGWVTQAAEAADRAVREEPSCPLAHTLRGIVLDDAGASAEALAELEKAHALSPGDERIALTLAQLEGRSGHRDAALRRVRGVLQQDPGLPQAHYLMGWLMARAAPHTAAADAEAIRQLRQALAENPQQAGALTELGAIDVRQGQFARARPLLEAAQKLNPIDPGLTRSLSEAYAHLGDPRAARTAALARRLDEQQQRRRALRLRHLQRPSAAAVTTSLARLELAAGQTQEATDLVNQVLHADPDNRAALDLMHEIGGSASPPSP
jgi:Flp pilus assembly protein TadD